MHVFPRWQLRLPQQELTLVSALEATKDEREKAAGADVGVPLFNRWYGSAALDEATRPLLLGVIRNLGDSPLDFGKASSRALGDRVRTHLRNRRLLLIAGPLRPVAPAPKVTPEVAAPAPTPAKRAPKPVEEKAWVEVEIADDSGAPVNTRYILELPDGTKRTGTSTGGKIVVEGIDPGTCNLTFPDIDGKDISG